MKNLPFSILNSNELYTISTRIVNCVTTILTGNEYAVTLCTQLNSGNSDLAKGLGKSLNSEFTPILFAKDEARDKLFIGLRDYISAFCHSSNTAKATAATLLARNIENVGNTLYSLGYTVETAKLNTLIANLSSTDAIQALATIGATDWFQELTNAQNEFEKTFKLKVETESAIDYPMVKDAKGRITRYLKALLSYIDTNSELNAETYRSLKQQINDIITDVISIARARATRIENEKKQPTQQTVEKKI